MLSSEITALLNAQHRAQHYWWLLHQNNKHYPHDSDRTRQTRQAWSAAYQLAVEVIKALQSDPGFDPGMIALWRDYMVANGIEIGENRLN